MGIFDKFFSPSKGETGRDSETDSKGTPWIELQSLAQLDDIIQKSNNKQQLIFKHSTRCGISRMVINQFKKDYPYDGTEADLYYLDLLNHRDISAAITDRFKVAHESPQLLIVRDGKVIRHASHGGINDLDL